MAWVTGQIRKIEKRGKLIFNADELSSQWLQVYCSIVQLPYNLSQNFRYNPELCWFGHYTVMVDNDYALRGENISFVNSLIFEYRRGIEQFEENMVSYFETVLDDLESLSLRVPVPVALVHVTTDLIEHPLVPYKVLKFVLAEGCIALLTVKYLPFEKRVNAPTADQPPEPPIPPSSPPNKPPKEGEPPTSGVPGSGFTHEISPPYVPPNNDGGDTYVPPLGYPPLNDPTTYGNQLYKVKIFFENAPGAPPNSTLETIIFGKYQRTTQYHANNTGVAVYYKRSPSSEEEASLIGGTTTDQSVEIRFRVISIIPG